MSQRLLVVDLAARSKNWALTPEGERGILSGAPTGWRVHVVRALTSSDGDGPREPSAESMDAIRDAEVVINQYRPLRFTRRAVKFDQGYVELALRAVLTSAY